MGHMRAMINAVQTHGKPATAVWGPPIWATPVYYEGPVATIVRVRRQTRQPAAMLSPSGVRGTNPAAGVRAALAEYQGARGCPKP